ncbi:MAG: GGDEF domain-containing protein [Magnetococcales bacterium]|nr:GGDEF domain-containing protein [Magnetococcales bacterium]
MMFDIGLGRFHRDHPATRLLISVLTNGVKYVFARDAVRQKEVERILKELARGVSEEDLEPRFLEPLRLVSRWLRETADEWAKTERFGNGSQRELADLGETGLPPDLTRRMLQGIGILGQGETWIASGTQELLQRLREVEDSGFVQDLARFCDRVIEEGEGLQRTWLKEREVFVTLVAEVAGYIHDVRRQTGGLDQKLGGSIERLKGSRSVTDLIELREVLVREAESLKAHTQQVNQRLFESQRQLRETQDLLVRVSGELAQTKVESLTDRLTGIPNRRALDQYLEREVARSVRHGLPLSLLMFDLDHFKMVNDNHGHPVGDKVLATVAGRTMKQLRQSDYLARFGGEEFTVILPETDLAAAVNTAQKIRQEVASLRFKIGNQHLQVTASFGVCTLAMCMAEPGMDDRDNKSEQGEQVPQLAERLVNCADLGLYRAKKGGRNRVETVAMDDRELAPDCAAQPPDPEQPTGID